jgi:hypothetical protein
MSEPSKRISRSERYKRKIAGLSDNVSSLIEIIETVAPELGPERQQEIQAAVSAVKKHKTSEPTT